MKLRNFPKMTKKKTIRKLILDGKKQKKNQKWKKKMKIKFEILC